MSVTTLAAPNLIYTVAVKKTVMFSFRSVPLERKRNARSIGRKRYVPFPKTIIERWVVPLERAQLITAVCSTRTHATTQLLSSLASGQSAGPSV